MRTHQRWASAPPVQDARCCAELAGDSSSVSQHAASAPPEDRPLHAAAAGAYFGGGACFGNGAGTSSGPSMPELMGVSPVFGDRILPRGTGLRPEQARLVLSPSHRGFLSHFARKYLSIAIWHPASTLESS